MQIDSPAIICGLRTHGEHGAIVRMLTPDHGLVAGYVRGGRGRRMRPVLIAGNAVAARLRSRSDTQLPQATVELTHSRAGLLSEPLPAAAVQWVTAVVAAALPEMQPYPRVYQALSGLLDAIEAAPSASRWAPALLRFELLLTGELGYARDTGEALRPLEGAEGTSWSALLTALDRSGQALFQEVLAGRVEALQDCRERLMERLRRLA